MENIEYTIRNMRKEDIPQIYNIYREENWSYGRHILYIWHKFDPKGFKVAVTEKGEVIGLCCGLCHGENLAIIGAYVIKKGYRKRGIGNKLWTQCMKRVGTRNAMLNATPDMVETYIRRGEFSKIENEWTLMICFSKDKVSSKNLSAVLPEGVDIQPFQETHFSSVCAYDFRLMGYDRQRALKEYFNNKDIKAFVAFKNQVCVGFGTIQADISEGCHVTPLYANDPAIAEVLLKNLIDSFPVVRGFEMSITSKNEAARNLLKKLNCKMQVIRCARLYTNEKFKVDFNAMYGAIVDYSPF